jgi:hypothetical protein
MQQAIPRRPDNPHNPSDDAEMRDAKEDGYNEMINDLTSAWKSAP